MREKLPILNRPLRVLHIISGDLRARIKALAFILLKCVYKNVSPCVTRVMSENF